MKKLIALSLLLASSAAAADAWSVLPFQSRGVDEEVADTFRDLLVSELGSRTGGTFINGTASCSDVPCAREVGAEVGATVVVYGRLNRLGERIIASVTVVNLETGEIASQQKMSVDQVEDLEAASARIAEAIVTGTTTDQTAQLGQITRTEVAPARRREGQSGAVLRVGGVAPRGDALAAGFGVLFDIGYWYEGKDFSIEPHLGYRTSAADKDESYHQINFDVGANYILGRGDIAPFIGIGGGMRWLYEGRREPVSSGTFIRTTSDDLKENSGWGPGLYGRAGLLLFRTYTLRTAFEIQYDATFIDLGDDTQGEVVQAMNFAVSVMF